MKTVKTTFPDGTTDVISDSLSGALRVIANRYGAEVGDLITDESPDRTLVWLDEESAENCDGANAVAEISKV